MVIVIATDMYAGKGVCVYKLYKLYIYGRKNMCSTTCYVDETADNMETLCKRDVQKVEFNLKKEKQAIFLNGSFIMKII